MRIDLKTIALLALLPTAQLFAQVERASVSGIVSDKTGAAMPGADSYLDTDNHVALAGVSESGSVGADRRAKNPKRTRPCRAAPTGRTVLRVVLGRRWSARAEPVCRPPGGWRSRRCPPHGRRAATPRAPAALRCRSECRRASVGAGLREPHFPRGPPRLVIPGTIRTDGASVRGSVEEPRASSKQPGLCVLAQPVAEGFAIENDSLARILQVSLAPELIHILSDNLARRAHILGEQFVGERRHADRAILLHRAQAFRETDERAGQTARDVIHTETFDAVREIDGALHQELQQRQGQAGTLHDDVFDLGGGPGHQLGLFESRGLLAAMRQIQQCGLAKKLVLLVDVDNHLVAVIGQAGDFDLTGDNEVDVGGRLVLIVDHLAFLILHNAGAGQMREGIFECFLRCKYGGAGCHVASSKSAYIIEQY